MTSVLPLALFQRYQSSETGMQHTYAGIHTAVPTPLASNGDVVVAPLAAHIARQAAAGVQGVVPLGGTGEYTALSARQRLQVVETAVEAGDGKLHVIPGILSPGLGDAIDNAKSFVAAGAKALMVVTPYYFRPTQDGIVDYFQRFSDQVDADIILYEIPYRTGVSLHYETVARLAAMTRVVGIKACNPDLAQQMRVAELTPSNFAILSGEEDVLPLHIAMGAVGGIISSSNVIPKQWLKVLDLAMSGRLSDAVALHATMRPLIDAVFSEPNPAPMKAAMNQLGWAMGGMLPPLFAASSGLNARLAELLSVALTRELD